MAKLQFKTAGCEAQVVELKPGVNRLGRSPENDVCLDHPSVSGAHCELELGCGRISLRDCGSTNGTFLDGTLVQAATLLQGQTLRLGNVELLVADTEIPVCIPKFEVPVAALPVVLSDGAVLCRRHRSSPVAYRCPHCGELLCDACLHRLRRRGGKLLLLCPLCSYQVEPLGGQTAKKKSLLRRLQETTRLFLSRAFHRN